MRSGLAALHRGQDAGFTGLQTAQLLDQVRRIRQVADHLLVDPPGVDRHPFHGVQDGGAHRHRVRGEQAGGVAEQAQPIPCGDHQLDAAGLRLNPDPRPPVELHRSSQTEINELVTSTRVASSTSSPSAWSARLLISWARHGDQAAGPAARASASVR